MLSSLQAVHPCSKFSMILLPYWEYVHLHFDCLTASYFLLYGGGVGGGRGVSLNKNIIVP